jgi:hypothetical protein
MLYGKQLLEIDSHKQSFLTRTFPVYLPYVILTLVTVPVRVARMEDLSNDATASTRQHRACSESCVLRRWHANARPVSCGLMRSPLNAEPRPARSKPIVTTSPRPRSG